MRGRTRLAEEQAALRRVATLVAKESPRAEVFAKVAEEVANTLGDVECSLLRDGATGPRPRSPLGRWRCRPPASRPAPRGMRPGSTRNGVIASVLRDGRPAQDRRLLPAKGAIAHRAAEVGIRAARRLSDRGRWANVWGAMSAATYEAGAFRPETEARMARFGDLVATAIANAEARAEVERLVDEQAALRRVATLVAREASERSVFDVVAQRGGAGLANGGRRAAPLRARRRGHARRAVAHALGPRSTRHPFPVGWRDLVVSLHRTGEAARVDDWSNASGAVAGMADMLGVRSSVATPIAVEGRLWGTMIATTSQSEPLPAETETRWGGSATWSPRPSPTPRRAPRSSGSSTNRPRCGGWRPWSPRIWRRASCSRLSPRRSASCWMGISPG